MRFASLLLKVGSWWILTSLVWSCGALFTAYCQRTSDGRCVLQRGRRSPGYGCVDVQVDPEEITDEERRQAKAVNFGAAYGSGPRLVNYFNFGQLISLKREKRFSMLGSRRTQTFLAGTTTAANW